MGFKTLELKEDITAKEVVKTMTAWLKTKGMSDIEKVEMIKTTLMLVEKTTVK